jgi:hypothetical protein
MTKDSKWRGIAVLTLVSLLPTTTSSIERRRLGEIDFFGYKGLDIAAVRAALPFHEGDLFPPAKVKSSDDLKRQVSEKVKQVIGHESTSVSFVCCDSKQNFMVYIGLPGESYQPLAFNPAPTGAIRFPRKPLGFVRKWMTRGRARS